MFRTPIGRLRAIGLLEGTSFLVLLGVAMPLKYFAGMPEAVRLVGWVHGLLFLLFLVALAEVAVVHRWPWRPLLGALVAAVVPFGPFVLDARLRDAAPAAAPPAAPAARRR